MDIRVVSLLAGAQSAEGTTVIIDVYRAFTTETVAFRQGCGKNYIGCRNRRGFGAS